MLAAGGGAPSQRVFVASRDVPAGTILDASSLAVATLQIGSAQAALVYPAADSGAPRGMRAVHDLLAGQVIQRGDVGRGAAQRLVLVPVKGLPPVRPGDLVDLFALGDTAHPAVTPFAMSVLVAAVEPGAIVLAVDPAKTPAFLFAGSMPLAVAVVSGPRGGSAAAGEARVIASPQEAAQVAGS